MKFSLNTILAAAFLPLASANSNLMECATSETTVTDFFPHKVSPEFSEHWDISYHGTYKVLMSKLAGESYLLYQCGTEPPAGAEEEYTKVISIPPQAQNGVNVASTPTIAYLELLGLRTEISSFVGSESFISSPCLVNLINSGSVSVVPYGGLNNATALEAAGVPTGAITLVNSPASNDTVTENNIVIQEFAETSYKGTMEWIKPISAIFNLEDKANEVFEEATCRFEAIQENVASVTADMQEKPTVVWAYYSAYCEGWDVAECPNYYCDFADACDAEILDSTETPGSVTLEKCNFAPYMTTEEFVAFARDADHWIYPNSNWNDVYAENEAILNEFASVANQNVYDYQGQGSNAWFEQRFAEYDVVLNDFCLVAGTVQSTLPANRRVWLRNVFSEPIGTLETCEDPAAALEPRGNSWSDCDVDHAAQHEADSATDMEEDNSSPATEEDDHSGHDHADGEGHGEDMSETAMDDSESASSGLRAFTSAPLCVAVASLLVLYL